MIEFERVCRDIQMTTEMSGRMEANVFDVLEIFGEQGVTQDDLLSA